MAARTPGSRGERFELESFEWKAPDRLEVAGRFHGLQDAQLDEPVLVVDSADGPHRLRAAPDDGPRADDQSWRAQFVWTETPVGVEAAELELGPDMVVALPAPGTKRTLLRPRFLDVRRAHRADRPASAQAADVTLQAELVAAEQQVEELRAALQRADEDLARARADVEAERQGRAADAERFREGLARVRASAEQALEELRGQLEAAETARAQAEDEREALRAQVAAGDELKARIGALEEVGGEAGEIRDDAQRLLERLTKLLDVLDSGK